MNSGYSLDCRVPISVQLQVGRDNELFRQYHARLTLGSPSAHLLSPRTMRPISRAALRPYVCPSCRHGIGAGRRRFATQSDQSPEIYDVVCVGGGPAGLGLLAALRMSCDSSPQTSVIDHVLTIYRCFSRHIKAQSRPRRIPRSQQGPRMEPRLEHLLEPSQQSDPVVSCLFAENWSLGTP